MRAIIFAIATLIANSTATVGSAGGGDDPRRRPPTNPKRHDGLDPTSGSGDRKRRKLPRPLAKQSAPQPVPPCLNAEDNSGAAAAHDQAPDSARPNAHSGPSAAAAKTALANLQTVMEAIQAHSQRLERAADRIEQAANSCAEAQARFWENSRDDKAGGVASSSEGSGWWNGSGPGWDDSQWQWHGADADDHDGWHSSGWHGGWHWASGDGHDSWWGGSSTNWSGGGGWSWSNSSSSGDHTMAATATTATTSVGPTITTSLAPDADDYEDHRIV